MRLSVASIFIIFHIHLHFWILASDNFDFQRTVNIFQTLWCVRLYENFKLRDILACAILNPNQTMTQEWSRSFRNWLWFCKDIKILKIKKKFTSVLSIILSKKRSEKVQNFVPKICINSSRVYCSLLKNQVFRLIDCEKTVLF